jgi:RNA polymerase sigma factor (sigma-70 family)
MKQGSWETSYPFLLIKLLVLIVLIQGLLLYVIMKITNNPMCINKKTPEELKSAAIEILKKKRNIFLNMIKRLEHDAQLAEDILSSATVQLFSNELKTFNGKSDLQTYITSAVLNAARQSIKKQMRRKKVIRVYEHEVPFTDECSVSELMPVDDSMMRQLEANDELRNAGRMLEVVKKRMPALYPAFELHVLGDFDYAVTAEKLGITVIAAQRNVHRVQKALRALRAGV